MHIQILSVGKTKSPYVSDGEKDYFSRLKHYCQVESIVVSEEKIRKGTQPRIILQKEGERLLGKISDNSFVVVLDKMGDMCSSEKLSEKFQNWQNQGIKKLIFVIGGPLGLDKKVVARADFVLSLSKMTFTHEMTRLILLEQIYRSFTILKGEKYHK